MSDTSDVDRLVARCTACGALFAAWRSNDGQIVPMGTRRACTTCGGDEFVPATAADYPSGDEAEGDD